MLSREERDRVEEFGFLIRKAVFDQAEIAEMIDHYMAINAEGSHPGDFAGVPSKSGSDQPDPLQKYPRLIQMHHYDEKTRAWMNDPRLVEPVSDVLGQRAVLIQTMLYFKPPGARGQSFHQDNLYLRTTPIAAAWVALDRADEENGSMLMASGSHKLGLLEREEADTDWSFTSDATKVPAGVEWTPTALDPGDVLFFGGLVIHGSYPNRTKDRFRRSFICHYEGEHATKLSGESQLH
ncbi:MAG: phytanoyl-CoA dioxygenase family protein [Fimbriimonadales bacterium]|nr:phytanoyl-CoA dioxygenase family protein [Fimbriimonadales bacterium]